MKIVTWNAAWNLKDKFSAVQQLAADIYVIQECEDPERSSDDAYKSFAANSFWWGEDKNHGLGVFAAPHVHLEDNAWDAAGLRWFGSVCIDKAWDLVAVWSNPARKNKALRDYVRELKAYHALHAARFTQDSAMLGDFNSNPCWAGSCGQDAHGSLVAQLGVSGLVSAYHCCCGEEPGKESTPTFIHRVNKKPYHIDYAFAAPARIRSCRIAASAEWFALSDHCPLVLELDDVHAG